MDLTVRKVVEGTTLTLHLEGNLDISTTNQINPYLEEMDEDVKVLIFDFTELELMDSTGIGSIINAIHLSQEKGFKVKFEGVNELTDEIFETIGVYKILEAIQGEAV